MEIIPAIDIMGGKCVRLARGNYDQKKVYNEDPLEVAKQFEDAGLCRLHLVDLDGAKEGKVKNWKTLEKIAGGTKLDIDFGGGIQTEKDVAIIFDSGAKLATVGTIAVKNEEEFIKWLLLYGPHKFFLGVDVNDERIVISGWTERTHIMVYDFIQKYIELGLTKVFCTDVSKDGMMEGPSTGLYKNIIKKFPDLWFVASGGISSIDDLNSLQEIGCKGVIIGKAIYEGKIKLKELLGISNQPSA